MRRPYITGTSAYDKPPHNPSSNCNSALCRAICHDKSRLVGVLLCVLLNKGRGRKNEGPRPKEHASIIWPFFAHRVHWAMGNRPINPDNARNFSSLDQRAAKFIMQKRNFVPCMCRWGYIHRVLLDTRQVTLKLDDIRWCKCLRYGKNVGTLYIFRAVTS